jgi:hypothetical protein
MSDAPRNRGGRPKGVANVRTRDFISLVASTPGDDLLQKLSDISENPAVPEELRLESLRHLFGAFASRVVRKPPAPAAAQPPTP